jgi:hypothetical protein
MARRTQPLGLTTLDPQPNPIVVGAVPTRATQRRYGWHGLIGLFTAGNLANVVPVQDPMVPLKSPVFPFLQPSDVASNFIRVVQMTTINQFSPSSHSKAAHTDEPVPAVQPDPYDIGWTMPKKYQRGTGGHYTIPSPANIPTFPSFLDRLQR